jgi:hypothetical protein
MGDLSIWNKPLSADEIRTGYTSGFQGTEQGLVGLWRLGDLGSTVPDSGPNGYDGGANGNTNSLQFTPGYQLFTLPVVMPGAGTRTLTFRGTNSSGSANAFISNIAFTTSPVFVPPSAITYAPPALTNTSFENTGWTGWSSQGSGFAYNPTGVSMGWSFSGNAGVTQHGYGLDTSYSVNGQDQGNGDSPPDGNWGAFLQSGYGTNGSMSQTVSGFVAGQSYDLALHVAPAIHGESVQCNADQVRGAVFAVHLRCDAVGVSVVVVDRARRAAGREVPLAVIQEGSGLRFARGILVVVEDVVGQGRNAACFCSVEQGATRNHHSDTAHVGAHRFRLLRAHVVGHRGVVG